MLVATRRRVGLVIALAACAGCVLEREGGFPSEPTLEPGVHVQAPSDSVFVGRTIRLVAAATGDSAAVAWPAFVWSSSDTTVLVVDSIGRAIAVNPGRAVITATANGMSDSVTIDAVLQRADGGVAFIVATSGFSQNCAISVQGGLYCRTLVPGDSVPKYVKRPGSDGLQFTAATTGILHMCGTAAGVLTCWGDNEQAQLGTGSRFPLSFKQSPAIGGGLLRFRGQIAIGGSVNSTASNGITVDSGGIGFTCAISDVGGAVYCVGANSFGQLGRSPVAAADSAVLPVPGFAAVSIAAAWNTVCAVKPDGGAYCWGGPTLFSNAGPGGTSTPRVVSSSVTFVSITIGDSHACALTSEGRAYCWGSNGNAQLGVSASIGFTTAPTAVAGDLVFASLQAGERHTCGGTTTGELYCWGDFFPRSLSSRLGTRRYTPVHVMRGVPLLHGGVTSDRASTCVVTTQWRAVCM